MTPLESLPADELDWHPGSNAQVLDFVHPSLYPLVYNKTVWTPPGHSAGMPETIAAPDNKSYFVSLKYQWLPSDFDVSADGSVSLESSYINNLNREDNGTLYDIIPKIMERAIPLWERVLSDLKRPLTEWRVSFKRHRQRSGPKMRYKAAPCIWPDGIPRLPDEFSDVPLGDTQWRKWMEAQDSKKFPAPCTYEDRLGPVIKKDVSLMGSRIQCIVKLANIVLTPENPEYPGGKWHVEGRTLLSLHSQLLIPC